MADRGVFSELADCAFLLGPSVSAIHAYVLSQRWIYEDAISRYVHVVMWRAELALAVCLPLLLGLAISIEGSRRFANVGVLGVCSAVFSLAMLALGLQARAISSADVEVVRTDVVATACALAATSLAYALLQIWRRRGRTARRFCACCRLDAKLDYTLEEETREALPRCWRDIVFVEGTSCLGKTTVARRSFDMMEYVKREPLYRDKHSLPYMQALYEAELYADLALLRLEPSTTNDRVYADRGYVSQFCYATLFAYEGESAEPELFAARVDREVFGSQAVIDTLRRAAAAWRRFDEATNTRSTTVWCVSDDPDSTARLTLLRANPYELKNVLLRSDARGEDEASATTSTEAAEKTFASAWEDRGDARVERSVAIAKRYIVNQNHVFERTCAILNEPIVRVKTLLDARTLDEAVSAL